MRIDHFRIEIQQFKTENDRRQLNKLVYSTYPDVLLEVHESLGPGRNKKGTPRDFTIEEGPKGIFALKKIVERFDPWLTIEGHAKLDRSDFPRELFLNVSEGGVGKQWADARKRIPEVIENSPYEIRDADFFRVVIKQVDSKSRDRDYLNEIRHNFSKAFEHINEKLGPSDVETGTPKDFLLSIDSLGFYVAKKLIERFDPWITVSGVKKYDRVDMPKELFGTVEEGGVGRNWSESAKERVQQLDWP